LEQLDVNNDLLGKVKSTRMGNYGHVVRKYSSLEKEVTQGVHRAAEVAAWTVDISEWSAV